jgi:hypothetical protein
MCGSQFRKREGKIFIDIRHDSDGLANNREPRSSVFGRNRVLQCARGIDFRVKRGGLKVSADDHRVVLAQRRQVAQNRAIQFLARETILNFRLEFANRPALFLARTKTRKLLFARFRSGAAGFAVTTKGLTLTGLTVTAERFALTGLTVTAERFALTVAWRTPIARERLTFTGLTVTAERFALTVAWRTPIARERLAFSRLRVPIERLALTGLTVTAERFTFTVAWRTPIAHERLPFAGFAIPIERLPFAGFAIATKRLALTVAGWSFAAGTIVVVFRRAKTARTRFAR